mmetsp:Transcript_22546/g.50808  ORF Transcript_22546/g.50808 Transcript_22546/m.50808 type:complete len:335 (-) Transcript_22546:587-1591(-)
MPRNGAKSLKHTPSSPCGFSCSGLLRRIAKLCGLHPMSQANPGCINTHSNGRKRGCCCGRKHTGDVRRFQSLGLFGCANVRALRLFSHTKPLVTGSFWLVGRCPRLMLTILRSAPRCRAVKQHLEKGLPRGTPRCGGSIAGGSRIPCEWLPDNITHNVKQTFGARLYALCVLRAVALGCATITTVLATSTFASGCQQRLICCVCRGCQHAVRLLARLQTLGTGRPILRTTPGLWCCGPLLACARCLLRQDDGVVVHNGAHRSKERLKELLDTGQQHVPVHENALQIERDQLKSSASSGVRISNVLRLLIRGHPLRSPIHNTFTVQTQGSAEGLH